MSTTLIFGGSGKVARHLTKLLVADGGKVYSVIRNPAQKADLEALGASPVVQSIDSSTTEDLRSTIDRTSPDAVVWSAGAGGQGGAQRTVAVDFEGAVRVMDALAASKAKKRFVMVSAVDVRDRSKSVPSWYTKEDKERADGAWDAIPTYMQAKLDADKELVTGNAKRGLEYTIVRPVLLTTDPGAGRVRAGKVGAAGSVSREDVASVVQATLKNRDTIGLAFDLMGPGEGDLPVADAVARVARDKEDTFEGHY